MGQLRLSRDQIAKIVGNDPEAIKQFEKLFGLTQEYLDTGLFDSVQAEAAVASIRANEVAAALNNLADAVRSVPTTPVVSPQTVEVRQSYVLPTGEGGTGNTATPDDGEFLIGNGLGFTLSTLTAGANITITNGSGSVEIAGAGGTVTSIDVSGGTTGLTFSGGPVTTSGTITMAGTLAIANGGTGATDAATALANLNGADLAGAIFTGTVESPFFAVDADYFLGITSGDPYVIFDTNDYLVYDRSANIFYISAGAPVCGFDSFGNILMGTMTPTTSATHTIHFQNATAPSTDPTGGGALYVESGALKYRGSGGTITTLAAA